MSYFGSLIGGNSNDQFEQDGGFSPDGRYLAAVTHRGRLSDGVTEATVWLFRTADIVAYIDEPAHSQVPTPVPIVQMAAALNGPLTGSQGGNVITNLRWRPDSSGLLFLAARKDENRQLFSVRVKDGRVKRLTPRSQDVAAFSLGSDTIVYAAREATDDSTAWTTTGPGLPDVQVATGTSLFDLLYPNYWRSTFRDGAVTLWMIRKGKSAPIIDASTSQPARVEYESSVFEISPNETYVLVSSYMVPAVGSYRLGLRPRQYALINLTSGEQLQLSETPVALSIPGALRAAWSLDGGQLAVSRVLVNSDSGSSDSIPCVVATFEVATRRSRCVSRYQHGPGKGLFLHDLRWDVSGQQLRILYRERSNRKAIRAEVFRLIENEWISSPADYDSMGAAAGISGTLHVSIHEALNEPPALIATDTATGKSGRFFDPNPQLRHVTMGRVNIFTWHDKLGRTLRGGLVKPPNFVIGQKYPLVIQSHGFDPNRFLTTGGYESGYAARALASRGMIVLQTDEPLDSLGTTREASDGAEVYLSAIDALAADGIVDPGRVGILGWSRMGMYVWTALFKAPGRFSVAALPESDFKDVSTYLLNVDYASPERADGYASSLGGPPFGEGLKSWLENAAGFNTEGVKIPILFEHSDPVTLIYGWSAYAMMRAQKKPVELLFIRSGRHNLMKSHHRWIVQELHVDWFDFWLNGHEDSAPTKEAQYRRWRSLRKAREARGVSETEVAAQAQGAIASHPRETGPRSIDPRDQ